MLAEPDKGFSNSVKPPFTCERAPVDGHSGEPDAEGENITTRQQFEKSRDKKYLV